MKARNSSYCPRYTNLRLVKSSKILLSFVDNSAGRVLHTSTTPTPRSDSNEPHHPLQGSAVSSRFQDCFLLQVDYNSRFGIAFFSQRITKEFPSLDPSTVRLSPAFQESIGRSSYVIKMLQRSQNVPAVKS